jgi:ribosomal protein L24
MIVRGTNKGREGKVTSVYRLKYVLHISGGTYTIVGARFHNQRSQLYSRPREEQRPVRPDPHRCLQGCCHKAQARQGRDMIKSLHS